MTGERPVERRLRQAMEARAEEVTVRSLRPADPPGPHLRAPRVRLRRSAWVLAGLSGLAAAAVAGYLVLGPDGVPARPVPPAAPPELTPAPTPTPTPGGPSSATPSPEPSQPSTGAASPRPTPTPSAPSARPQRTTPAPPPTQGPVQSSAVPSSGSGAGQPSAFPSPPR
ncbi:hypothetical protein [Streptomyces sp. NPDC001389]|uniref:hypothetical protein n=1 Tax=unclassified Streptomyces TaxID=2593676 RepID=UPI0036D1A10B